MNKGKDNYLLLPICLILGMVPLITKLNIVPTDLYKYSWFYNTDKSADIFLYSKGNFLIIVSVVMLLIIIGRFFTSRHLSIKLFIPLGIYGILCLLSSIFSDHRNMAFNGSIEQYESIWILLSYLIALYYSYSVIKGERDLKVLIYCILFSTVLMCAIGFTQLIERDIFTTELWQRLIIPNELAQYRGNLSFNFGDSALNKVYMTLYNPNYVGVYAVLIIPVLTAYVLAESNKKLKLIALAADILLLVMMLGAGSKTGIITLTAVLIFSIALFRKKIKINKLYFSVLAALFLIILGAFNYTSDNMLIDKIKSGIFVQKSSYSLKNIVVYDEAVEISYKDYIFKLSKIDGANEGEEVIIAGDNNLELEYDAQNKIYKLNNKELNKISISVFGDYGLCINIEKSKWYFDKNKETNKYTYINIYGRSDEIINAESSVFTGYEKFLTSRGYIWSRTIPLIKDNIILGSGPDTFVVEFPQTDYVAKSNTTINDQLITKPHSLYLQIAVQTGLLSLIAFLAFYFMYFIQCIKVYGGINKFGFQEILGAGIFLGSIGYMIAGVTNDSCVATAPVFWTMLGIGVAININAEKNTVK